MEQKDKNAENKNNNTAKAAGKEQDKEQESFLEKFFCDQLKDIYYAEQYIVKSLPKMQKAATTDELKEAFEDHLHQTNKQVRRLEKVFSLLDKKPEGKKCEAIEGLIKEAESIIDETEDGSMTRDAALIMAAQKIEHYEIATYGGLVQFAMTMNLQEVADLLDRTLQEESETDQLLTDIAESYINIEAEEEGNFSWSKEEASVEKGEEVSA